MLDNLLSFGASFDWGTPLCDLYKDLNNGPHHDFHIDRHCGRSVGYIQRLLNRHGVHPWGWSYSDDLISFRVRKSQAWWAQNVMEREGLPIVGGQVESSGTRRQRTRQIKPAGRVATANPIDAAFNWLDTVGGWFNLS